MTKKITYVLVVLTFVFVSSGCAKRINQMLATWEGQPIDELIVRWGPPSQVLNDQHGGKIYVYYGRQDIKGYAHTDEEGYTTVYLPDLTTRKSWRMFFVNSKGIIYKWAWRGYIFRPQ